MIHSGGAYGGHYSAYIKDFEADSSDTISFDCWYHFNDSYVRKIPVSELISVFGKE
jgi:ubiquitin C-terminal hydrolase